MESYLAGHGAAGGNVCRIVNMSGDALPTLELGRFRRERSARRGLSTPREMERPNLLYALLESPRFHGGRGLFSFVGAGARSAVVFRERRAARIARSLDCRISASRIP